MLINPPFQFAHCTHNLNGTPPNASVGNAFTAGANNADGTSVAILTNVAHEVHFLVIGFGGISASTANSAALCDIRIDPAGGTSWQTDDLITDLVCGFTPVVTAGTIGIAAWYFFPLYVPSGRSFGVRARTAHTSNITGNCVMYAYGSPSRPDMWWCGSKVESLGINAASSSGTSVTPGNTGAAGTWTNIGSTTTGRYGAVQFGVNGSDAASTAIGYYWQIGYGGSQLAGSPTFYTSNSAAEISARTGFNQPIWCNIPSGTQMQARGTASGTAEVHNVALYGVM